MAETTPTPPEQPPESCELCKDATTRLMATYGLASVACKLHKGENKTACLALIVPLETGEKDVDPEDVLADIMLLGDNGKSIDDTADIFTSIIEGAATRAAEKASALINPAV